LSLLRGGN